MKILAALALAAAAVVGLAAPSSAAVWNDSLWFKPSVCVQVDAGVDPSWHVARALAMWRQGSPVKMHLPRTTDGLCRTDRHIEIQQVSSPNAGWTGITRTWDADYRRSKVVIKVNAATTTRSTWSEDTQSCYRTWVSTHELGHALGLAHRMDVPDSVMSYDAAWSCGVPAASDFRVLQNLYTSHGL